MQIYEVSFQALAKHLIDQGREDELRDVELQMIKEAKSPSERAAVIRAFAEVRVAQPALRKRLNLPPNSL